VGDFYFETDAGYGTARVRVATPTEAIDRARRDARARANLEAFALEWHPDDEEAAGQAFAYLRDALGLDARPTREPGTCAHCGIELPMWMASPSTGHSSGYCSEACRRRATTGPGPNDVLA
jgi:hypothetical protein